MLAGPSSEEDPAAMLYEFVAFPVPLPLLLQRTSIGPSSAVLPAMSRKFRVRQATKVDADLALDHVVDEAVRASILAARY